MPSYLGEIQRTDDVGAATWKHVQYTSITQGYTLLPPATDTHTLASAFTACPTVSE